MASGQTSQPPLCATILSIVLVLVGIPSPNSAPWNSHCFGRKVPGYPGTEVLRNSSQQLATSKLPTVSGRNCAIGDPDEGHDGQNGTSGF